MYNIISPHTYESQIFMQVAILMQFKFEIPHLQYNLHTHNTSTIIIVCIATWCVYVIHYNGNKLYSDYKHMHLLRCLFKGRINDQVKHHHLQIHFFETTASLSSAPVFFAILERAGTAETAYGSTC